MRLIRQILTITALLVATIGSAGLELGCRPSAPNNSPVATLSGRVTGVAGQSVTSGVVTITSADGAAVETTITETGAYMHGPLRLGPARIEVHSPGFELYSANLTLVAGSNRHDVQLVRKP